VELPWIHEGGMEVILTRLADPYTRARNRQKLAEVGFKNFGWLESWADIRIANSPTAEAGSPRRRGSRSAAEPGNTHQPLALGFSLGLGTDSPVTEPTAARGDAFVRPQAGRRTMKLSCRIAAATFRQPHKPAYGKRRATVF
jgi:hypothetical protein